MGNSANNEELMFALSRTGVESYMIGDSHRDVEAGENAGVKKSIKVEENKAGALIEVLNQILIYK